MRLLILILLLPLIGFSKGKLDIYLGANYNYSKGYGVSAANTGSRYTLNNKIKWNKKQKNLDWNISSFILYDKTPSKIIENYFLNTSLDFDKNLPVYPFVFTELERNLIEKSGVELRLTTGIGLGKKFNKFRLSWAIINDNYKISKDEINNPIWRNSFRFKYDDTKNNLNWGCEWIYQPMILNPNIHRTKLNSYIKWTVTNKVKLGLSLDNFIDVYPNSIINRDLRFYTLGLNINI